MKLIPLAVLPLLASACFTGCSSVSGIRVSVLKPSAVNLSKYELLAVPFFVDMGTMLEKSGHL